MSVDLRLRSSGVPARMGAAAFTIAATVEEATGGWNHRVTSVVGQEPVPAPLLDTSQRYPIPPGPASGLGGKGGKADNGLFWPAWSAVAPALPFARTVRPVGGGYVKPPAGGFVATAPSAQASDLTFKPQIKVRQGARQGRVTTAPKPTLRWVRQGG